MCGNMVRDELLVIALFGRGIEMERGLITNNEQVLHRSCVPQPGNEHLGQLHTCVLIS